MPSVFTYCSIPAFWSGRIEVSDWSPVSGEYALEAWLYRSLALGQYTKMPYITYIDGEIHFSALADDVLSGAVPSESDILSAANTLRAYHFTGDEVTFGLIEHNDGWWYINVAPTNSVEPAPTPTEIGAYMLALNGFFWSYILSETPFPVTGLVPEPELFLWNPEYATNLQEVGISICAIGLDWTSWSAQEAEAVRLDIQAQWLAATPSA